MSRMIRVLCVDDDTLNLSLRRRVLESMGFNVCCAAGGLDGLHQFQSFAPDVVVLDYEMPDLNGDVVAWAMKQVRPRIPILLFTAHAVLPITATENVDAHLVKGGSPQILCDKLQQMLGSANSMAA